MSDYYGSATLEDWLAEEVFSVEVVPKSVIELFEGWREGVKTDIENWMGTDDGDGCSSWRGWGRGFNAIPDEDDSKFDAAIEKGKLILAGNKP